MKKILTSAVSLTLTLVMLSGCSTKTANLEISSPADLDGLKIAVQEGTTGDAVATETFGKSTLSRFKKAIDCGVDLKNGKVDGVVMDAMVAKKIAEQIPELMILDEELSTEEYAIAVKKGNTVLLEAINNTLTELKNNGKMDEFYNAFIVPKAEQKPLAEREKTSFGENVVMGTNAEFEPFEYREGDKIVGYDIEVANEIAKSLSKDLKIEDMNFDSLIPALTSGKVDFVVAGMSVTEERKQNVDFSTEYFNASQVVLIRKTDYKAK